MTNIQSIHSTTRTQVSNIGLELYTELSGLITCCHNARDAGDSTLGRYLLWSMALNFDEDSHSWFQNHNILNVIKSIFSLNTLDNIKTEQMHREDSSNYDLFYSESLWTPMFVNDGLTKGSLSKWQVVHHMTRIRKTESKYNNTTYMNSVLYHNYLYLEESQPKDIANSKTLEEMMVRPKSKKLRFSSAQ